MSVFVFGSNFMTQLGIPEEQTLSTEKPIKLDFFEGKKIIKVSCGKLHTLVLTEGNELYTWGCNDDCALGRAGEEGIPTIVEIKQKIVDIQAGASYSALLTDRGQVLACGTFKGSNGILGFDQNNKFCKKFTRVIGLKGIKFLGGGDNHIIATDRKNIMWTFGSNDSLQLGRAIRERNPKGSLIPSPINKRKEKFSITTGGGFHSVGFSESNIYSWGSNYNGQMGIPEITAPTIERNLIELENIKNIACGINHTLFLSNDNILYGAGDNTHSQLGIKDIRKSSKPIEIMKNVQIVRAGCDSTMVLSDSKLYACGINFAGCLGQNEELAEISEMKQIDFDFGKIIDFDCGADFTVVYSE